MNLKTSYIYFYEKIPTCYEKLPTFYEKLPTFYEKTSYILPEFPAFILFLFLSESVHTNYALYLLCQPCI